MNMCGHRARCICRPTVASAALGGVGCRNSLPSGATPPADLSPKPLRELLPLPSVLSRKPKDLRSLFLRTSGSPLKTDQIADPLSAHLPVPFTRDSQQSQSL